MYYFDSDSENSSSEYEYSDSGYENYEMCPRRVSRPGELPFDPASLEKVIFKLCDRFDFCVVMNKKRSKNAMLVTTGLKLAGTIVGKRYGGNLGAAVGGAVGGACGAEIEVVSMRQIWGSIQSKLADLFDIVYDHLAGLGLKDYKTAAMLLTSHQEDMTDLAMILLQVTSASIGKKVLSSLHH